ncbi:putative membrane protein (plasmid) [Pseudomonas syringae pv. cerasicola]|uniref:Putative membrane protein n=1 Tax=Pseudomonas syringae pv. cerasicola TaxID=264451 RepID=A0A330JWQ8_PSESX|nr:putative membrane protein [Pseudomonas syringae pv. cerasicola]SOS31113.1 putative membrane protein [Pseudomonas syringae pv. cerasicola]SOS31289.1 putative membrane protein [Pseudomonas syringae pv. cerasicola]SOS31292.1 putative membrane protein [Pseudomonas syringae pv. cerasicola]SOS31311.1 putative membrane protein [Pseudomonas syringae pv. cerasicola]
MAGVFGFALQNLINHLLYLFIADRARATRTMFIVQTNQSPF